MHIEFCAKLNFLEGEYAITQNIGFLLSWVSTLCRQSPIFEESRGGLMTLLPSRCVLVSQNSPYNFKKSYGGSFVLRLHIVSTLRTVKPTILHRQAAQVPVTAPYCTTKLQGSTKDPYSAMLVGHSMLNTVVLGEGMSKYQIYPLLWLPQLLPVIM